ncbi:MAG: hypothetical protein KDC36_05085 [Thermoleophilia bacterium]|nr:hypothetical protein [Thermoleophilia bacterium]
MKPGWLVAGFVALLIVLSATGIASYHLCVGPVCAYSDPADNSPLQVKMRDNTPNPLAIKKPDPAEVDAQR